MLNWGRGLITGNYWIIESLQKRYHGYFQPYIQKMIMMTNQSGNLHA